MDPEEFDYGGHFEWIEAKIILALLGIAIGIVLLVSPWLGG